MFSKNAGISMLDIQIEVTPNPPVYFFGPLVINHNKFHVFPCVSSCYREIWVPGAAPFRPGAGHSSLQRYEWRRVSAATLRRSWTGCLYARRGDHQHRHHRRTSKCPTGGERERVISTWIESLQWKLPNIVICLRILYIYIYISDSYVYNNQFE